jgi:predicted permease
MELSDVRFGFRQLRKRPGFTVTALLTLGLCIGANTAIYSVVDAVLLRPVPYPDAGRLAMVVTAWQSHGAQGINTNQTGTQFERVRDGDPDLDVAVFGGANGVNFSFQGHAEFVRQQRVSTGYFRVLGVAPQLGREFSAAEDKAGGPPVTVLSYNFWQRVFHGDPGALGRAINLRGEPYTVVGIMPAGFRTEVPGDLWTPLRPSRTGEGGGSNYEVAARIKPGISWNSALARLEALPVNESRDSKMEERLVPFQSGVTAETRGSLLLTWAAVLVVLLIGCVNIAGLLLARSQERRREIATRMALGASRGAVIRQLLAESVLLALAGGVLGVLLGQIGIAQLKRLGAEDQQLWHPIALDLRVLAAMLAITLFTSVVFGLVPALEASGVDLRTALVEGGRGVAGGGRRWLRSTLVIGEVALSMVLLISAGLLVRSLAYLNGLNPGFDTHNVLSAQTSLQDARYASSAAVNRLYTRGLEQIRRIAGVESAAVALSLPYERPLNDGVRPIEVPNSQTDISEVVYVTPGYFETMRIPVRDGRAVRESDRADSAKVAVVSERFARKFFPGQTALRRHLETSVGQREIVGVVGDIQQHSGSGDFGPLSVQPTLYLPVSQMPDGYLRLIHTWFPPKWVVRAQGSTGTLAVEMKRAIASVDAQLPVAEFHSVDELREKVTGGERYNAVLFSLLAGLALLLAAIGLYGLISQSVAQRTREMGIRMALGASAGEAMAIAMKPGITFALAGVVIGIVLALAAVRLLQHMLWGVRPVDVETFAFTGIGLLAVAAVATLLPALRLRNLDPAQTLRDE